MLIDFQVSGIRSSVRHWETLSSKKKNTKAQKSVCDLERQRRPSFGTDLVVRAFSLLPNAATWADSQITEPRFCFMMLIFISYYNAQVVLNKIQLMSYQVYLLLFM
jgi:hypothetical protein